MAIGLRIVGVRDGAGCEGANNFGVIELPFLIVALANHGISERVQNPRSSATGSLVEVAWILFEEGRQYSASDERTGNDVTVRCTEALRVAFCALPVCSELVRRLVNSGHEANPHKGERVDNRPPGKLELQLRRERSRIGDVADKEIWNEAEHTLLLLLLNLLCRHLDLRECYPHFRHGGGNIQHDLGQNVSLSRAQGYGERLGLETRRRNCELKGPRREIAKGELPIVAGQHLLCRGWVSMRQPHLSADGDGSGLNNHRSTDAP